MTINQLNDYAQMLVQKLAPFMGYKAALSPIKNDPMIGGMAAQFTLRKDGAGGAGEVIKPWMDLSTDEYMLETIKKLEQSIFAAYIQCKKILPPMRLARDFPNGFTLKSMHDICGGEAEAWEAYFLGVFDDEVRTQFENAQHPGVRITAVIMRAAMKVMKEAK